MSKPEEIDSGTGKVSSTPKSIPIGKMAKTDPSKNAPRQARAKLED